MHAAAEAGPCQRHPLHLNGQARRLEAQLAAYDANGNLASDGQTAYVYDAENRLVSASGATNATLSYDPLGRLRLVTGASGTRRYVYDGDRLIEEYDGAGNRLRLYGHGPGTDEPLILYELTGGPVRRYLHADHQGSIVAIAAPNAAPLAINAYDAWGIPNQANQGRFGYTGQTWIPELGLWHYKARVYSPTLGRFLQTDPVGYNDQINLYTYVANDPMNNNDPTGKVITVANPDLQRRIAAQINSLTRGKFGFDKNGNLRRESTRGGTGRSGYYERRLVAAIAARPVISIAEGRTSVSASGITREVERDCKGACIEINRRTGDSRITISGRATTVFTPEGRMFPITPGEVVMHELVGHAIPAAVGRDTGNAVQNENRVRQENGLPLRPLDPDHEE